MANPGPDDSYWRANGGVTAFDPASKQPIDGKIVLALSNKGSVDTNSVTRIQYAPVGGATYNNRIRVTAPLRISYSDYFFSQADSSPGAGDANTNNRIYVMAFLAKASYLSANPTPMEIMWASGYDGAQFRSSNFSPAPSVGDFANFDGVVTINNPHLFLEPNTKYWLMAIPVVADRTSTAPAYSRFLNSMDYSTESYSTRAISFWTNRTPLAPTITSPGPNTVLNSGDDFTLSITNDDPDRMLGGNGPAYTDRSGVHVQYSAMPSAGNPDPAWSDVPFADSSGVLRKGWWLYGSPSNVAGEGILPLVYSGSVDIKVGSNTPDVFKGLLPSGSWRIRVRTFDWGHPWPERTPENNFRPGGFGTGSGISMTPNNFPATNTSPWSSSVSVIVSAQVPSPVPISPTNNVAVPDTEDVILSWQYRNTSNPPFAQALRTVDIRKVGDANWTRLVTNQPSSASTFLVASPSYTFVSGNAYEWRVMVTDTDSSISTWSSPIARFWYVPSPSTGPTRPLPSNTIDGASLGCGSHRVFIYRRGGKIRVGELTGVSLVDWSRLRDDISSARIIVNDWGVDCGNLLAKLQPWAYELVIIRDNGFSSDRVWEGPITLLTYEKDRVVISAKDVMGYAYRRIIKQQMTDRGVSVVNRATRVLQNVFAPDDPNVLSYLTVITRDDDPTQYRSIPPYSRTAFEEVDDMASNSGLDYTCVGRSILLWGTKNRVGLLPEFRDQDFGNSPIVSVYGMSMANVYAVSDGNGIYGEATRLDDFGNDETYGLVEMLSSSWATDMDSPEGMYTQEARSKTIESFEESAERSISSRFPPPVVVRIPDNTTLNPDAVISIQHLVPGVAMPLRSNGTLRSVRATQKLDSVRVVEQEGKETISITVSPFSRQDNETEEGETE